MQLEHIVNASRDVARTRSRIKKRDTIAALLRAAPANEIELVVSYLGGELPQGRIGLGPAIVRDLVGEPCAGSASLTIAEVDRAFSGIAAISGKGSQQARREALGQLFHKTTPDERDFIVRLILGELRQGALEGVLIDGIAAAAGLPPETVRRAVMLAADPAPVAFAAMSDGAAGLDQFRLTPMSPVKPMLAQPAEGVADAMESLGSAALDVKLDGARVQIHRVGSEVKVYSRALNDVTASLPDVVETVLEQPAESLILDGEVIALRDNGRPHPFQVTMRRFGRRSDVDRMREELPLNVFLFDILHRDGEDLIDRPFSERDVALNDAVAREAIVPRSIAETAEQAQAFLNAAFDAGHEGIMAKSLTSSYAAGNRGADWLKIKQAHTLDLVVLAAEWGSGRRQGWLSNLHLGARNPLDGSFVMLGKTFKGLTDKVLDWQTKALLGIEIGREEHVVHVRPELVVEIAVNEIQASPVYPAGMALRFARVKRYRKDKTAAEADTIETVREIFAAQGGGTD